MSLRCAELMQAAEGHSAKPWFNKSLVGVTEQVRSSVLPIAFSLSS